ncbi:hypothetical protein SUDANB15_07087 [Streptomyces sp. enrichment culture]|uniref:transposase n=1 Tax=Streptomyces sp. enrichment culture TaxID=1795815 RepID=UPI003F54D360
MRIRWNRARERTTQLPQRDRTRRPHRRGARPTAAVIDARSVKASANVAGTSQGIDAGKKTGGRGRHVISDTLGLVLAVLVTAASVHDTTGGKLLLDDLAAAHPSCRRSGLDGGCQSGIFNRGAGLGIDVEVVQRPRAKGLEPLPRRWVTERTFGWPMTSLAWRGRRLPQRVPDALRREVGAHDEGLQSAGELIHARTVPPTR